MQLIFLTNLVILITIVNGHLHANEQNSEWKLTLRSELESKIQTMFTNYSKQYNKINNQQLKLFLDSFGSNIQSTTKIRVIDHDHDHDHEEGHDHDHDHSHQETPNINLNCLRTKLDEMFNFFKSKDDNKTSIDQNRFLNSGPFFANSMASCFSKKLTHKNDYTSIDQKIYLKKNN